MIIPMYKVELHFKCKDMPLLKRGLNKEIIPARNLIIESTDFHTGYVICFATCIASAREVHESVIKAINNYGGEILSEEDED